MSCQSALHSLNPRRIPNPIRFLHLNQTFQPPRLFPSTCQDRPRSTLSLAFWRRWSSWYPNQPLVFAQALPGVSADLEHPEFVGRPEKRERKPQEVPANRSGKLSSWARPRSVQYDDDLALRRGCLRNTAAAVPMDSFRCRTPVFSIGTRFCFRTMGRCPERSCCLRPGVRVPLV